MVTWHYNARLRPGERLILKHSDRLQPLAMSSLDFDFDRAGLHSLRKENV